MGQKIEIATFDDNNTLIGIFSIECDKTSLNCEDNSPNLNITFQNIPVVNYPDDITPIQYYNGFSNEIANILLLEETNYTLSFKAESNFKEEDVFYTLRNQFSLEVFNSINFPSNNFFAGNLNFRSYVGKTFLDVVVNKNVICSVPIEVRSKKINYLDQYSVMIADLSKYSSNLIFELKSPLFKSFELNNNARNTFYEDYMFLEFLFRDENLPSTFEYLSKNLYCQLEKYEEEVPTSLATDITPENLINAFMDSNNLLSYGGDIFNGRSRGFIPLKVNDVKFKDNIDTPENRFYKNFLVYIDSLIDSLLDIAEDGYIKDKLLDFSEKSNYFLSQQYFKEISPMDYEPLNSQVLQKKEGYRNILQYFSMLQFSFRMNWDELTDKFRGYEKKLSELYEYWCYFELLSIIEELTEIKFNFEDIFEINKDKWHITLKQGNKSVQKAIFNYKNHEVEVSLYYNQSFYRNSNFKSFSLNLRPDYTIKISCGDKSYFIHFDAKYKVIPLYEKEDSYNPQDIYKMHTYKDAIEGTLGAYVLYPGDVLKLFWEGEDKTEGVGAFPLNPGYSRNERNNLVFFIKNLIDKLINR